jgi:hypothetical protein
VTSGGIRAQERLGVEAVRRHWHGIFRQWQREWFKRFAHKNPKIQDLNEVYLIALQIKHLRRHLGIRPTPDEVRQQTRLRVRAHRERRKMARALESTS